MAFFQQGDSSLILLPNMLLPILLCQEHQKQRKVPYHQFIDYLPTFNMSHLPSSKPVDLSTKKAVNVDTFNSNLKMEVDTPSTIPMPLPMSSIPPTLTSSNPNPNPGVGSSIFHPSYDNINAVGQPVLDLHSALNNIHKSFTIGSKLNNSMMNGRSPSPPCQAIPTGVWMSNFANAGNLGHPLPPPLISNHGFNNPTNPLPLTKSPPNLTAKHPMCGGQSLMGQYQVSKYNQLLQVLEEMNKDVRPSYAGSKSSAERLKRGIAHARILVREALIEAERHNRN